ncbi:myosin heavy chain, fast skeletal muscle-like isoform X5 [Mizuhopecten yessoensis]|uniref:myosin heavy chain, fast skeletal muscle-like isoform X5 n=1 Tax=Mizuhopecten yessoensis TaxID=6573 RepID=UPI000B45C220|nr:myosin heavy chain, fast skeletal muscle-like isoform X5 [Mizuhopecten yessoensis]
MYNVSNQRPLNRPGLHTPHQNTPGVSTLTSTVLQGQSTSANKVRPVNLVRESLRSNISAIRDSIRSSASSQGRQTPTHIASLPGGKTSSLKDPTEDLVRTEDFDQDDAVTFASSSTIKDLLQDQVDTVPVRDQSGSGDMQGYFSSTPLFASRNSPIRGSWQDSKVAVFPDNDSGFSSMKRSFNSGDDMAITPRFSSGPMVRSQSMNRLNGSFMSQELTPLSSHFSPNLDRSLKTMSNSLEDSENRRCVLMHKLKEAQDTLDLQSNRLGKIENSAKGNTVLVEDLKFKEMEYRKKIKMLEDAEQDKDILRMENIRLRQEMQDRIDRLDFALRSLQAQHMVAETDNQKRINLLDQSTTALSMLESENKNLRQDKETLAREVGVAKESMRLAKVRFEPLEDDNKNLRMEVLKLKEENADLTRKLAQLTGQLTELRALTNSMKEENEKLASSWKSLADEKQVMTKKLDNQKVKATDMQAKASSASVEKDRLFQEKMDLNNKYQHLIVGKEQLDRANSVMQEQINDLQDEVERVKKSAKKKDMEKNALEDAVQDIKQVNEEISSDLASVKAYYERALEQISVLENGKKMSSQQQDFASQEKERLLTEVERLSKRVLSMEYYNKMLIQDVMADGKSKDIRREREEFDETIQALKNELRELRHENSHFHNKNQELETKLRKANEDIRSSTMATQQELDTWKDTCDSLTASVHKKESEIQALMDRCEELDEISSRQKTENRALSEECETLTDQQENVTTLKSENRKLIQENAENEQMIKLLETQKEVLTKSSENSLAKLHNIDQLTGKVDQLRNENEHFRDRILELEKVRDNLISQKEELLASTELIYKKPRLEDLENKVDELEQANRQLRDMNESMNNQFENLEQTTVATNMAKVNQAAYLMSPTQGRGSNVLNGFLSEEFIVPENVELKEAVGGDGSLVPKVEMERVEDEKENLQRELERMSRENQSLQERHEQYVDDYGPDGQIVQDEKDRVRKLEREKEGLERQVALINGSLLLVEGSKKRLDEVVEDLQHEIVHLRKELEEAEKQIIMLESQKAMLRPVGSAEMEQLQSEIDNLRGVLSKTQADKLKQERIIKGLKEESLDDVGTDLNDMRGELHKLMGVIETKDQAIETLEGQLKHSKNEIENRQKAMDQLQGLMTHVDEKRSMENGSRSPRRKSRSPVRSSKIPRKTDEGKIPDEELTPRSPKPHIKPAGSFTKLLCTPASDKDAKGADPGISVTPGLYGTKFLGTKPQRTSSTGPGDKGGDRLQSLISKYRSHSESPFPERKIKPLSLSPSSKMGLVTRGRSFGPAAPKSSDEVSSSSHTTKDVASTPGIGFATSPTLPTFAVDAPKGDEPLSPSSSVSFSTDLDQSEHKDQGQSRKKIKKRSDRQSEGDVDDFLPDGDLPIDEDDLDTQEQDDINALIKNCYRSHLLFLVTLRRQRGASGQARPGGKIRSTHPKSLLSVNPPKLTSKIIADLLKTGPPSSTASKTPAKSLTLERGKKLGQ